MCHSEGQAIIHAKRLIYCIQDGRILFLPHQASVLLSLFGVTWLPQPLPIGFAQHFTPSPFLCGFLDMGPLDCNAYS